MAIEIGPASAKFWYGVIVIAYKQPPLKILLVGNTVTGNFTPLSGAVEGNENQKETATREIQEEVGWQIAPGSLQETDVRHEFTYRPNKPGRAGDKGSNQVFLLDASGLGVPAETTDTKNPAWLSPTDTLQRITFDDLRHVVAAAMRFIPKE